MASTLSRTTLTAALRLPGSFPKSLLYAPMRAGGLGIPNLVSRFTLRFLAGVLRALNSRNHLLRHSTRWLLSTPAAIQVADDDISTFRALLDRHQLRLLTPPPARTPSLLPRSRSTSAPTPPDLWPLSPMAHLLPTPCPGGPSSPTPRASSATRMAASSAMWAPRGPPNGSASLPLSALLLPQEYLPPSASSA